MYSVYNSDSTETLLKTGRQVSKTLMISSTYSTHTGKLRKIEDVAVGDSVLTMSNDGSHVHPGKVTWKSKKYTKPCLRIKTRLGHVLEIATTHPVRVWDDWVVASELNVGQRVASLRKGGVFTGTDNTPDTHLEFCAFMIGDGHCGGTGAQLNFTKIPGTPVEQRFSEICAQHSWKVRPQPKTGTDAISYCFRTARGTEPRKLLEGWELWRKSSAHKFVPDFVWELSKEKAALFLNRLWSTDGMVGLEGTRYQITYSSISEQLVRDVQTLLWKFGIPTCVSSFVPEVYEGTDKRAWVVRVETQPGVVTFLTEIGALGKSENVPLPNWDENNNRDTYPIEIQENIQRLIPRPNIKGKTLHAAGLRKTLKYPLTLGKFQSYIDYFESNPRCDQHEVSKLAAHLDTHLYWDEIESIEDMGKQPCRDIEVESTHNFITSGVVTHNSVYCANLMVIDSIRIPHFKTLYITPTREQTSKFSNTRLGKVIHYSPHIRKNYIDTSLPNNVLLQVLANGSVIVLSYAMDDPDRVRGNSADRDLLDEVQDIHYESVIPVVKECMAASPYAYLTYCGTPKSVENTIEFLWQRSTKSEWIMKCEGCNKWQFVSSAKSIGAHGVICLHCGKQLNVRGGKWYEFNPNARLKGFHISQPMLPANNESQERWDRIIDKMETYSETKFKNEVLGESDAIETRFISQQELLEMCYDYVVPDFPPIPSGLLENVRFIAGGVDWSGGGAEILSRTVVWVWGFTHDGKYRTLFFKIFPGNNPIGDVEEVGQIFEKCRCDIVVGDAGEGAVANSHLVRVLGKHRMFQAQYGSFGKLLRWNKKDRYLIDRTAAIDSYMLQLKNKGMVYPNARQMAVPIQDVLNEYEESTQTAAGGVTRKIWRHAARSPDDCLHAQVFGWLAMKICRQDLELYDVD